MRDLCVYYRGNLDSPVSFIVASDYNCERCVQFEKTLSNSMIIIKSGLNLVLCILQMLLR